MTHTETDLRDAFASLALDDGAEPDVSGLRARLAALTVDDTGTERETADAGILDLHAARPERQPARRPRLLFLTVAAAILAALVGLVAVVLPDNPTPTTPADKLREIAGPQYPGTVAVSYVEGTGPRTLAVPVRALRDGFVRRAAIACDGRGRMFLNGGGITDCSGSTHFTADLRTGDRTVVIDTPATTTWQLVFTQGPQTRTNGSVGSPVSDELTSTEPGRFVTTGTGQGVAVVPSRGDLSAGTRYQVKLTCSGSGVRVPAATSTDAANVTGKTGVSTRTCFAGWEYVWQNVAVRPGERLGVDASSDTVWRIFIAPM